jgi:hypothetical protein
MLVLVLRGEGQQPRSQAFVHNVYAQHAMLMASGVLEMARQMAETTHDFDKVARLEGALAALATEVEVHSRFVQGTGS